MSNKRSKESFIKTFKARLTFLYMEKSGHLKMENLMVTNMYRKQASQDHRDNKRGRQQRKFVSPEEKVLTTGQKSRNTSLNLIVDYQLDHLSVNFGRKGDQDQNIAQGANLSVLSGYRAAKREYLLPKEGARFTRYWRLVSIIFHPIRVTSLSKRIIFDNFGQARI